MTTEATLILVDAQGNVTDDKTRAVRGEITTRDTVTGEVQSILFEVGKNKNKEAAGRAS